MMDIARFDQLSVDADQSERLVKLLDAVVIKLEGGTDLDLQVLESAPAQPGLDKVLSLLSLFRLNCYHSP